MVNQPSNDAQANLDLNNRKRRSTPKDGSPEPKPKCSKGSNGGSGGGPNRVTIVKRETPCSSTNDPNKYRVIVLSNGLTALLISRQRPVIPDGESDVTINSLLKSFPYITMLDSLTSPEVSACFFIPEKERFQPAHHLQETLRPSSPGIPIGLHSMCTPKEGEEKPEKEVIPYCNLHGDYAPRNSRTSIALVVNVGGVNDPENAQGLAHFTEHMVHYGSRKFPREEEIIEMVNNFGTYNASTSQHSTSYFNEVPDELLDDNLDMFSEMLTNPTFHPDTLGREVQAVDSEFYLRVPLWRSFIVLPYVSLKSDSHPLARFLCGTVETLTNCTGRNGQLMQKTMRENHQKNYVASAMTLAINSTKSIEELEDIAVTYFSRLLQGDRKVLQKMEKEASKETLSLKNTADKGKYVYLQGNDSRANLNLVWMLPASLWLDNTDERVPEVLESLLSDTSEGSLDAHLRGEGLVWLMFAGANTTHYATMIQITFFLTESGRQNTEKVIRDTLVYIRALVDQPQQTEMKRFFEELRISRLYDYHFGPQNCSLNCTINSAMKLQYTDTRKLNRVLCEESWVDAKFCYKSIADGLRSLLNLKNLVIIEIIPVQVKLKEIRARERDSGQIQSAPYSNVSYFVATKALDLAPKCPRGQGKANLQHRFELPPPNPFLKDVYESCVGRGSGDATTWTLPRPENAGDIQPQRLQWRSKTDPAGGNGGIPKITGFHVGHRRVSYDPYYGFAFVIFHSPFSQRTTPRSQALALLWAVAITNKLEKRVSEYYRGGYRFNIVPGMFVIVKGYPKHFQEVFQSVISAMLDEEITEANFNMAKNYALVLWEMKISGNAGNLLLVYLINSLIQTQPSVDLGNTIKDLTLNDLRCSVEAFRRSSFCTVLLGGNIPTRAFEAIAETLDSKDFGPQLDNRSITPFHYPVTQPDLYWPGEKCIRVRNLTSSSLSTSVTNVYVMGPYIEEHPETSNFRMAMNLIHCQAFMYLRTQRQLGYVVHAQPAVHFGLRIPVMMFIVHVTSTAKKFSSCEIDEAIDQFLAQYGESYKKIKPEIFGRMKNMTYEPESLTQTQVGDWLSERFGTSFAQQNHLYKCAIKGIRKVSIQILSGNSEAETKECTCERCGKVTGWKRGPDYNSQLEYAVGGGDCKTYFATPAN